MSYVEKLQLNHFRSYREASLEGLSSGAVILYGANGAGKTNILEAVSLLSPGRGLRGARMEDVQHIPSSIPPASGGEVRAGELWAVSALVQSRYGEVRIGTGRDPVKENRRAVRINGEAAKAQTALSEYLSCVWLTPQMDRLFIETAGNRRRFLDRLVFAFDGGHAGRITRYENAMRQRSKLLQGQAAQTDSSWLDALEATMAETGVSISAARLHFLERLQQACDKADDGLFPKVRLGTEGTIEGLLRHSPAIEVEEMFKYQLKQSRAQDAITGGAATGPHKGDLEAWFAEKDMRAELCSTGEQKALLVSIILAHSRLIAAEQGVPPLLLLDEVSAHLDGGRREGLYELLLFLGGQVWLTGTDKALFNGLWNRASAFEIADSTVSCLAGCRAA